MRKKLGRLLERWGYYGLALLCAAVILLSALWTREQPLSPPASQALSDGSQRLSQAVSPAPSRGALCRPTAGALLRGYSETPVFCNAQLDAAGIRRYCVPDDDAAALLSEAYRSLGLSARGYDRILRLGRTIADLDGADIISDKHISEAIMLRSLDKKYFLEA